MQSEFGNFKSIFMMAVSICQQYTAVPTVPRIIEIFLIESLNRKFLPLKVSDFDYFFQFKLFSLNPSRLKIQIFGFNVSPI